MTTRAARRLLIDLQPPFPGRWNGVDAFRSAHGGDVDGTLVRPQLRRDGAGQRPLRRSLDRGADGCPP